MDTRVHHSTSVLTVSGSDSAGCAGAQADLRTIAAFGLHGLSAITAVTAQTTRSVDAVRAMPAALVAAQLAAAFADFRVGAVKTGMLANTANVAALVEALQRRRATPLVVDPVLVSTSGTPLLTPRARRQLWTDLLPLASVVTPNVPEAEALLDRRIRHRGGLEAAARDLLASGARAVLLKGGHLRGAVVRDVLVDADGVLEFTHARLPLQARGTGCVLATAIACGLARGTPIRVAVAGAERYLQRAFGSAYRPGRGRRHALGPASPSG